jgi:hypothetical protein
METMFTKNGFSYHIRWIEAGRGRDQFGDVWVCRGGWVWCAENEDLKFKL